MQYIFFSGSLSQESSFLIKRMGRSLPPGPEPLRIFAENLDVEIWNSEKLLETEGKSRMYYVLVYPLVTEKYEEYCFILVRMSNYPSYIVCWTYIKFYTKIAVHTRICMQERTFWADIYVKKGGHTLYKR